MKNKITKGYKAFDKDFKCRDLQYEVGKEYKHDGEIKLCAKGFHFCENPFDVLRYYPLIGSKFAEIEVMDKVETEEDGNKSVSDHIKIAAQLDLSAFVKAAVEFTWNKASKKGVKEKGNATSGNDAHSATSGNYARTQRRAVTARTQRRAVVMQLYAP